jgi:HAD superfamily hydrolase (TIGR01549 family)
VIKGVVFDVDGTLLDSVELHARAWQETLRSFGHVPPYEQIRKQIGKGGDQLLATLLPASEVESHGKQIENFRQDLFRSKYLDKVHAFPRVRELFQRIRMDGRRIVLASSAKAEELQAYKRIADIEDLVDGNTSSSEAPRSKPYPDIFQAALDQLRPIVLTEAIAVGDTPYDAQAAGKAGLSTIGFTGGPFTEAELREAGCVTVYRGPSDLLEHYESSPLISTEL